MTSRDEAAPARSAGGRGTLHLGLYVEPELRGLAQEIASDLGEDLNTRYEEVDWEVGLIESDGNAAARQTTQLIAEARRRTLAEGYDLAVYLTKMPLRKDRRPVIALTSAMDRVGVISVPALGAVGVGGRARDGGPRSRRRTARRSRRRGQRSPWRGPGDVCGLVCASSDRL